MEHSAEWLRGRIDALEELGIKAFTGEAFMAASALSNMTASARTLLAAAEAREAGKLNVEAAALARIHSIASRQLAEPAGAGDAVAMAKICTEVEAVGLQKPTQLTAAEVIAGAKKALEELLEALRDDMPLDAAITHSDAAVEAAAAWEAAQR